MLDVGEPVFESLRCPDLVNVGLHVYLGNVMVTLDHLLSLTKVLFPCEVAQLTSNLELLLLFAPLHGRLILGLREKA